MPACISGIRPNVGTRAQPFVFDHRQACRSSISPRRMCCSRKPALPRRQGGQRRQCAPRRHQAPSPGKSSARPAPADHAVLRRPLARRHAHQLRHGEALDRQIQKIPADGDERDGPSCPREKSRPSSARCPEEANHMASPTWAICRPPVVPTSTTRKSPWPRPPVAASRASRSWHQFRIHAGHYPSRANDDA